MNSDRIYLHHQSCNRVKVIADALKTIGSQATIRFRRDRIICIHCNHDRNVCVNIDIDTDQLFKYEYESEEDEVLVSIRPASLSSNIGTKKNDTLVMDYHNNSMEIGLYTTTQQNSEPNSFKRLEITQGEDVQHIPAQYPDKPNLKVTGVVFRQEMLNLTKEAKYLFVRPYTRGLQILGQDAHGIMIYIVNLGIVGNGEELFYSPNEEDEDYDDEIYDNNCHSIAHDPLCRFDHIQTRHKDFVPLIGFSKLALDSSIIGIYYNEDRNLPIKFEGPSGTEGTWTVYIRGFTEEDENEALEPL